jgi:hypothetical protein
MKTGVWVAFSFSAFALIGGICSDLAFRGSAVWLEQERLQVLSGGELVGEYDKKAMGNPCKSGMCYEAGGHGFMCTWMRPVMSNSHSMALSTTPRLLV